MAEAMLRQQGSSNLNPGFIYVIQMQGHPIYKIGRASSVPRRMSQIGIQLPFPFELRFAHKVPNVQYMETWLHREYRRYRKNGEWFELPDIALDAIKTRLLYAQSEWLTQRIVDQFGEADLYPDVLRDYGMLFFRLGKRNGRRLDREVNISRQAIPKPVIYTAVELMEMVF